MSILPDAETFRRLADGSMRGPGPAALRAGLALLATPYGLATTLRNACYDRGLLRRNTAPIPVISVGNLTLGGTGKTPLVAWVARLLAAEGRRPAVISRGYGARPGEVSDEAAELAILIPGVPHVADRDRARGAAAAAARGADVAILDDGFQHRRLRREFDLVAIDASDPFGCDHLFPRGLLRESPSGLARAHAVVLTRAGGLTDRRRTEIRDAVLRARRGRPPALWLETDHRPVATRTAGGRLEPLAAIAGRRTAAFCGIGNPAAFRDTLAACGLEVAGFRGYADHHAYSPADGDAIAAWAGGLGVERIVTTLKDLVKIRRDELGGIPLVALEVAIEPLGDPQPLAAAIVAAARKGALP
jgi:tetraacyldisaccharide 4'-kinase